MFLVHKFGEQNSEAETRLQQFRWPPAGLAPAPRYLAVNYSHLQIFNDVVCGSNKRSDGPSARCGPGRAARRAGGRSAGGGAACGRHTDPLTAGDLRLCISALLTRAPRQCRAQTPANNGHKLEASLLRALQQAIHGNLHIFVPPSPSGIINRAAAATCCCNLICAAPAARVSRRQCAIPPPTAVLAPSRGERG